MTRQLLAETIYFLVKDDEQQYQQVLLYLSNLVRYDSNIDDGMNYSILELTQANSHG